MINLFTNRNGLLNPVEEIIMEKYGDAVINIQSKEFEGLKYDRPFFKDRWLVCLSSNLLKSADNIINLLTTPYSDFWIECENRSAISEIKSKIELFMPVAQTTFVSKMKSVKDLRMSGVKEHLKGISDVRTYDCYKLPNEYLSKYVSWYIRTKGRLSSTKEEWKASTLNLTTNELLVLGDIVNLLEGREDSLNSILAEIKMKGQGFQSVKEKLLETEVKSFVNSDNLLFNILLKKDLDRVIQYLYKYRRYMKYIREGIIGVCNNYEKLSKLCRNEALLSQNSAVWISVYGGLYGIKSKSSFVNWKKILMSVPPDLIETIKINCDSMNDFELYSYLMGMVVR